MDHSHQSWTRLHNNWHEQTEVPINTHTTRSWALVHHAMFHMYPYHYSQGYATFFQVLSGTKYWVVMRPKGEHMERWQLYRDQLQFRWQSLNYDKSWDHWLIVPEPGDIMFVFLLSIH